MPDPVSHTRGPWVSFYKDKYREWHVGVPVSTGSMKVALFPDGCPTENPEADCHLIATAPDLLALAKKLAGECVECDGTGWLHNAPGEGDICPVCRDIYTVIGKAEGRP